MTLRLAGSTSGYTEIDAPAVAGNNNLKLPTGNGSDGNILGTDGAGNLSWVNGRMVLATAQSTTSGTSIDFTGIPSWVKRVTVMFNGVSTNGTSNFVVQVGAGSIQSSSYSATALNQAGTPVSSTSFFPITSGIVAAATLMGSASITLAGSNTWVLSGASTNTGAGSGFYYAGNVTLSGTLDRLRLTTVNGTDTFDAGSINILYEG
jgi:hypothetical protein